MTRENYGFRAIAYSKTQLEALRLDAIIVLRADPDTLIGRVKLDPRGRREMTTELAGLYQQYLKLHPQYLRGLGDPTRCDWR